MKQTIIFFLIVQVSFPLVLSAQVAQSKNCIPCEQLRNLQIPDVTILEAKAMKNDTIEDQVITVPFCHVLGLISKGINFELLLPARWNKRFLMSGGGGFVGSIGGLAAEACGDHQR